jgi:hypothetical protein
MAKSDLEQRLSELPEDQFAQAAQAFEAAKSARSGANDGELRRKVANMTDAEFNRFRDEIGG